MRGITYMTQFLAAVFEAFRRPALVVVVMFICGWPSLLRSQNTGRDHYVALGEPADEAVPSSCRRCGADVSVTSVGGAYEAEAGFVPRTSGGVSRAFR